MATLERDRVMKWPIAVLVGKQQTKRTNSTNDDQCVLQIGGGNKSEPNGNRSRCQQVVNECNGEQGRAIKQSTDHMVAYVGTQLWMAAGQTH